VETTKKLGRTTPPFVKYAASKTLAEQAAWKFVEENIPSFDIVTLLPTFVWGVSIHYSGSFYIVLTNRLTSLQQILSETTAEIKGSNNRLLGSLKKDYLETLSDEQLLEERLPVDSRDAAKFHVEALLNSLAGGRRIILAGENITVQHICKLAPFTILDPVADNHIQ
jgi:nucleoside-diphosphate-sugar epimerase